MDQPPSYNEIVNPQFYPPNPNAPYPNQMPMPHQPVPPYSTHPMEHHVVYTNMAQGHPGDVITQQPTTIVIVQQTPFTRNQMRMRCPFCQADIKTKTVSKAGLVALLSSLFFCAVGFPFGCCCIGLVPYCLLQNKKHFCP